ncbi:hypothetical protein HJD18_09395 [Thermoleophilia bacterium SCSIO 60948]|nr:hypothetical protein HJD18_09395 [Thermoleophilia bacterium SCSIO 60948]
MSPAKRPPPDEVYRGVTKLFSGLICLFGITIVIVTLANGGGVSSAGFLIGVVFTLLGAGRLYLAIRISDANP